MTKGSFSRLVARSAELSTDGRYRYSLSRVWDDSLPIVLFIGLNPSTADHERDDPTIRRCMRFARDWGCGTLLMGNLFALRSTDPRSLLSDPAPVGPGNDEVLSALARRAAVRVAAWGGHRAGGVRAASVAARLGTLQCLGTTRRGHPRHPLYVAAHIGLESYHPIGARELAPARTATDGSVLNAK